MSEITKQQYDDEVESTAKIIVDAINEYPEDYADDPWVAIHEDVDNHEWITYSGYHLHILEHSDEGPVEWKQYVEDDETSYRKVIEAMAYTAFRADVSQEVFDRLDDE